jgi:hypothetical protein
VVAVVQARVPIRARSSCLACCRSSPRAARGIGLPEGSTAHFIKDGTLPGAKGDTTGYRLVRARVRPRARGRPRQAPSAWHRQESHHLAARPRASHSRRLSWVALHHRPAPPAAAARAPSAAGRRRIGPRGSHRPPAAWRAGAQAPARGLHVRQRLLLHQDRLRHVSTGPQAGHSPAGGCKALRLRSGIFSCAIPAGCSGRFREWRGTGRSLLLAGTCGAGQRRRGLARLNHVAALEW